MVEKDAKTNLFRRDGEIADRRLREPCSTRYQQRWPSYAHRSPRALTNLADGTNCYYRSNVFNAWGALLTEIYEL